MIQIPDFHKGSSFLIAADISINSPALCITDGAQMDFVSVVRRDALGRKPENDPIMQAIMSLKDIKLVVSDGVRPTKEEDYIISNQQKFLYNRGLVDILDIEASRVLKEKYKHINKHDGYLAIEGYAYGISMKQGNAGLDIAELTSIFKTSFVNYTHDPHRMHVISPSTTKKILGKGNLDKKQILEAVLALPILEVFQNDFISWLRKQDVNTLLQNKGKIVRKPIDDLLDSFILAIKFLQLHTKFGSKPTD